jgi:hypothetical protein
MRDLEDIESINSDQLVTATDRILLTGLPRPRFARGSMRAIPEAVPRPARLAQGSQAIDCTLVTRRRKCSAWPVAAIVVTAMLASVASASLAYVL